MFNLKSYLHKYRTLAQSSGELKQKTITILQRFHFDFKATDLEIKHGRLKITTRPIIKGELLLQKEQILSALQTELPEAKIADLQ